MAQEKDISQTEADKDSKQMLQEERYLWMARAFIMMAIFAALSDLVLLLALSGTVPFLRVQPFYLQIQNKEDQVISIQRLSPEAMNAKDLQESLVRQYIVDYYTITSNLAENEYRWGNDGPISWMSSDDVFGNFKRGYASEALDRARDRQFTRRVYISSVMPLESRNGGGVWLAAVKFYDMAQDFSEEQVKSMNIRVNVSFQTRSQELQGARRLKNPLGFRVLQIGGEDVKE